MSIPISFPSLNGANQEQQLKKITHWKSLPKEVTYKPLHCPSLTFRQCHSKILYISQEQGKKYLLEFELQVDEEFTENKMHYVGTLYECTDEAIKTKRTCLRFEPTTSSTGGTWYSVSEQQSYSNPNGNSAHASTTAEGIKACSTLSIPKLNYKDKEISFSKPGEVYMSPCFNYTLFLTDGTWRLYIKDANGKKFPDPEGHFYDPNKRVWQKEDRGSSSATTSAQDTSKDGVVQRVLPSENENETESEEKHTVDTEHSSSSSEEESKMPTNFPFTPVPHKPQGNNPPPIVEPALVQKFHWKSSLWVITPIVLLILLLGAAGAGGLYGVGFLSHLPAAAAWSCIGSAILISLGLMLGTAIFYQRNRA